MTTIQDVKTYLSGLGIEVREYEQPTPNSVKAAEAVGCTPAEIAKTILFIVGGEPVAIVTCGDLKVNGSRLKLATGIKGKARLPDADEVIRYTGYAPGGVCPFLLPSGLRILIDSSMRRFDTVYAAAGNDHSAVPITVDRLIEVTGGEEVDVCTTLPAVSS